MPLRATVYNPDKYLKKAKNKEHLPLYLVYRYTCTDHCCMRQMISISKYSPIGYVYTNSNNISV